MSSRRLLLEREPLAADFSFPCHSSRPSLAHADTQAYGLRCSSAACGSQVPPLPSLETFRYHPLSRPLFLLFRTIDLHQFVVSVDLWSPDASHEMNLLVTPAGVVPRQGRPPVKRAESVSPSSRPLSPDPARESASPYLPFKTSLSRLVALKPRSRHLAGTHSPTSGTTSARVASDASRLVAGGRSPSSAAAVPSSAGLVERQALWDRLL